MLIKEKYITSSLLDTIPYLSQHVTSESTIPVIENSKLKKYIVSLEDINSFCEDNGTDPNCTIAQICKINNISTDDIAFSITEESVILEESVFDLLRNLSNNNVYVVPTKHNKLWESIGYELSNKFNIPLDEVTVGWARKKLGVPTKDNDPISDYVDVADTKLNQNLLDQIAGIAFSKGQYMHNINNSKVQNFHARRDYNRNNNIYSMKIGNPDDKHTYATQFDIEERRGKAIRAFHKQGRKNSILGKDKADELREQIRKQKEEEKRKKNMQSEVDKAEKSNDKNFIAKVIAKLHDWSKRYSEKYKETKISGIKSSIQKALSYITKAIAFLTKRLHNLTTKYKIE